MDYSRNNILGYRLYLTPEWRQQENEPIAFAIEILWKNGNGRLSNIYGLDDRRLHELVPCVSLLQLPLQEKNNSYRETTHIIPEVRENKSKQFVLV